MDLDVFFAGTGGSVPTARRGMPALLVRRGGDKLLFDCGEGTQRQLVRSVGLPEVDEVLLTHFHADHWLGLPGMLKTFDLRDRERPLTVRGPRGLRELMKVMQRAVYGRVRYELTIEEVEPGAEVRRDGYTLAAVGVEHRIPALAWVLWEDERPGEFDAAGLARDAEVRLLALTHVSTRYGGREIRDEARAVFERTVVPRDFDAIEIPFPERGEPHLVRFEEPVAR